MPAEGEALGQLNQELVGLEQLDDESLLQAARSHLALGMARRLENLHRKRQREGLSETEGGSPYRTY